MEGGAYGIGEEVLDDELPELARDRLTEHINVLSQEASNKNDKLLEAAEIAPGIGFSCRCQEQFCAIRRAAQPARLILFGDARTNSLGCEREGCRRRGGKAVLFCFGCH